jgi:hypothetical protein
MIEIFLYSSLTCQQAEAIMLKMKAHQDLPASFKVELIETVKDSTPECYPWDAQVD